MYSDDIPLEGISSIQMRMARAALDWTMAELSAELEVSKMAISKYERGVMNVIGVDTIVRAKLLFERHGLFFGPRNGVCVGVNVFHTENLITIALHKLLAENNIHPTSGELLSAYKRAVDTKENI